MSRNWCGFCVQAGAKLGRVGTKTSIGIVQYDPEEQPKKYQITQNRVPEVLEWKVGTLSQFAQGAARNHRGFIRRKSTFWEISYFFVSTSILFLTIWILRFAPEGLILAPDWTQINSECWFRCNLLEFVSGNPCETHLHWSYRTRGGFYNPEDVL